MSEWKPIETAPRDGTRFLFSTGPFYRFVGIGFFITTASFGADSFRGERYTIPSHWMPLPEPPND